jgi:hypothetical protein
MFLAARPGIDLGMLGEMTQSLREKLVRRAKNRLEDPDNYAPFDRLVSQSPSAGFFGISCECEPQDIFYTQGNTFIFSHDLPGLSSLRKEIDFERDGKEILVVGYEGLEGGYHDKPAFLKQAFSVVADEVLILGDIDISRYILRIQANRFFEAADIKVIKRLTTLAKGTHFMAGKDSLGALVDMQLPIALKECLNGYLEKRGLPTSSAELKRVLEEKQALEIISQAKELDPASLEGVMRAIGGYHIVNLILPLRVDGELQGTHIRGHLEGIIPAQAHISEGKE